MQGRQTKLHPGFTLGKLVQPSPGISILRDSHIVLSKRSQPLVVGTTCDCEHNNVNHSGQLDTRVVEIQCDSSVNIRTNSLPETTNDSHKLYHDNSFDSNLNVNDDRWFSESGLKVASLNVNRLIGKLDQIKMCIDKHTPDVFGLCETFLNSNVDNQMVQHENYITERKDYRVNRVVVYYAMLEKIFNIKDA